MGKNDLHLTETVQRDLTKKRQNAKHSSREVCEAGIRKQESGKMSWFMGSDCDGSRLAGNPEVIRR
jgi:hypothetical protein